MEFIIGWHLPNRKRLETQTYSNERGFLLLLGTKFCWYLLYRRFTISPINVEVRSEKKCQEKLSSFSLVIIGGEFRWPFEHQNIQWWLPKQHANHRYYKWWFWKVWMQGKQFRWCCENYNQRYYSKYVIFVFRLLFWKLNKGLKHQLNIINGICCLSWNTQLINQLINLTLSAINNLGTH